MGGKPSRSGSDDENRPGGPVDAPSQLVDLYSRLVHSEEVKGHVKDVFRQVRILVIGRSGSGKSTLIRLMVGDSDGPRTISNAKAGKQAIDREWRSIDPNLPVIFHDSNGMGVDGGKRLKDIKTFMDKRQIKQEEFAERIHFIWYVINGTDNRFLDDGGALQLVSRYGIPLLLIITHNDHEQHLREVVTDSTLEELLRGVEDRDNVRKRLIKVGNYVLQTEDGDLTRIRVDSKGLELLSQTTRQLIDKKLMYTWVAAQAVNAHDKIDACARLIAQYNKFAVTTAWLSFIPLAEPIKFAIMLARMLKSFCTIWRVPPNFDTALFTYVAMPEGTKSVLWSLLRNICSAGRLVVTLCVSANPFGTVTLCPAILGYITAEGKAASEASLALISYSSVIVGSILYAKSLQLPRERWDGEKSIQEYRAVCDEFATTTYVKNLAELMKNCNSIYETIGQEEQQMGKIKTAILECFKELAVIRPNGLHSMMLRDEGEAACSS